MFWKNTLWNMSANLYDVSIHRNVGLTLSTGKKSQSLHLFEEMLLFSFCLVALAFQIHFLNKPEQYYSNLKKKNEAASSMFKGWLRSHKQFDSKWTKWQKSNLISSTCLSQGRRISPFEEVIFPWNTFIFSSLIEEGLCSISILKVCP